MNNLLAAKRLARSISLLFVVGSVAAGPADAQQKIGTCSVLPGQQHLEHSVDTLPILSNSASMATTIGANTGFHADFGAGTWNGRVESAFRSSQFPGRR